METNMETNKETKKSIDFEAVGKQAGLAGDPTQLDTQISSLKSDWEYIRDEVSEFTKKSVEQIESIETVFNNLEQKFIALNDELELRREQFLKNLLKYKGGLLIEELDDQQRKEYLDIMFTSELARISETQQELKEVTENLKNLLKEQDIKKMIEEIKQKKELFVREKTGVIYNNMQDLRKGFNYGYALHIQIYGNGGPGSGSSPSSSSAQAA